MCNAAEARCAYAVCARALKSCAKNIQSAKKARSIPNRNGKNQAKPQLKTKQNKKKTFYANFRSNGEMLAVVVVAIIISRSSNSSNSSIYTMLAIIFVRAAWWWWFFELRSPAWCCWKLNFIATPTSLWPGSSSNTKASPPSSVRCFLPTSHEQRATSKSNSNSSILRFASNSFQLRTEKQSRGLATRGERWAGLGLGLAPNWRAESKARTQRRCSCC